MNWFVLYLVVGMSLAAYVWTEFGEKLYYLIYINSADEEDIEPWMLELAVIVIFVLFWPLVLVGWLL